MIIRGLKMLNQKIELYHSRPKLLIGMIVSFLFMLFGIFIIGFSYTGGDIFFTGIGLLMAVLFGVFTFSNMLKLNRDYPYLIITDEYIQFDSFTRSEIIIYIDEIDHIRVSTRNLRSFIEIEVTNKKEFFKGLSFHNKIRLFMNFFEGVSFTTIITNSLEKEEQIQLIDALNLIIKKKREEETGHSSLYIVTEHNKEQYRGEALKQKYEFKPKVDRIIDVSYFFKSYKRSFTFFKVSFIGIYWLLSLGNGYLLYIISSLVLFPIAKVPLDYFFGFRMDQMYNDPMVFGSNRHQRDKAIIGFVLFQTSVFVAPFGFLFLIIRHKTTKQSKEINLSRRNAIKSAVKEKLDMDRRQRNKNVLMIIVGILAINFNFIEVLDLIEKYTGWFFCLPPLAILISQIVAIKRIEVHGKKKKLPLFIYFLLGLIFSFISFIMREELTVSLLFLLVALTNFLSPFTYGLTKKGLYYKQFRIRTFAGYRPVYCKYKDLSSIDFQRDGNEIKVFFSGTVFKSYSKKTLVFSLKDMTAVNKIINEFN